MLLVLGGCERGCLRLAHEGPDAAALMAPLSGTDCPDGLARCRGGVLERSRLAVLPAGCASCACPWTAMGACERGCVEDGIVVEEGAASQLCAPPPGAEDVLAASGTVPEGCDGSFVCRGGLVVRCADRALVASCARGCAAASLDDAVTPLAAAFVLCARAGDAGAAPR